MNQSRKILLGLIIGIATGLFFGEHVSFLEWPSKAFVQLLQVTVLPYIITSLIVSIAGGTSKELKLIASSGGVAVLLTLCLSLCLVFLVPLALPPDKGGAFFSAAPFSGDSNIDWLDLYIPSNPFRSLANNVVPAVVVFSVLVGIALIQLPGKEKLLEPLETINKALSRANNILLALTPLGIFAIAGYAAGTMRLEELERLQSFILIYIGMSCILALIVLPGLVSVLTGISHRKIISLSQDAMITAFVTGSLFVVLPMIVERSKQLLVEAGLGTREAKDAPDVLIPASFNFPHSAKVLSLSFILFAGWFAGASVSLHQYPLLGGAALLSFFGSLNSAIPFLLNLVRLPADLFQLFMMSGIINSHFGSGASVMHTMAIALIGAFLMSGRVRVHARRLLRFVLISTAITALFLFGSRMILSWFLPDPGKITSVFDQLKLSGAWGSLAKADVLTQMPAPPISGHMVGHRLDEIVERGVIRVGYIDDALPWAYRNKRGELVGFDIDMAHALAVQLMVRLELIPVTRENMGDALTNGTCDLVMSGIRATPQRAKKMQFSSPYTEETSGFLVHDYLRDTFTSMDKIRKSRPRIAVVNIPSWIERLRNELPGSEITPVESIDVFIEDRTNRFDAMFTGWQRAAAWSLTHPNFAAVVPQPDFGKVPLAYPVPKGEEDLLSFVNTWVDGRRASGLLEKKLDYWVYGKGAAAERGPRWSIAANVLGLWKT